VELDAGVVTGAGIQRDDVRSSAVIGIDTRPDVNLTSRLAIEARVAWFPQQASVRYQSQGGRTTSIGIGARARFVETPRVALFGVLRPGVLHFTNSGGQPHRLRRVYRCAAS
jgi:hypothetical protein